MLCSSPHTAGGGIVYDSEPDFEYWETVHKMAALARGMCFCVIACFRFYHHSRAYGSGAHAALTQHTHTHTHTTPTAIDLAEENSVTATQALENAENARAHAPAASSFNTMWTDAENRQGGAHPFPSLHMHTTHDTHGTHKQVLYA